MSDGSIVPALPYPEACRASSAFLRPFECRDGGVRVPKTPGQACEVSRRAARIRFHFRASLLFASKINFYHGGDAVKPELIFNLYREAALTLYDPKPAADVCRDRAEPHCRTVAQLTSISGFTTVARRAVIQYGLH